MSRRSRPARVGDLGHAQPARVVGEPDVAAELAGRLVERGPHQPEVLLRGVRAGEALAGRTLGHEVEQALPGRPDHGDHVGALAGRGLSLRDVLVDVAGRHDQVDPGLGRRVADLRDQALALLAADVDALDARSHLAPSGGGRAPGVRALRKAEPDRAGRGLLGELVKVGALATAYGVPDRQRDAVLEPDVGAHAVDEPVHPGGALGVGTVETGEPQRRALDRHRGVLPGDLDDRPPDLARQRPGLPHGRRVEVEGALAGPGRRCHHSLRSNRPRTPSWARSSSSAYAACPGV